jgi:hypothetical protein
LIGHRGIHQELTEIPFFQHAPTLEAERYVAVAYFVEGWSIALMAPHSGTFLFNFLIRAPGNLTGHALVEVEFFPARLHVPPSFNVRFPPRALTIFFHEVISLISLSPVRCLARHPHDRTLSDS